MFGGTVAEAHRRWEARRAERKRAEWQAQYQRWLHEDPGPAPDPQADLGAYLAWKRRMHQRQRFLHDVMIYHNYGRWPRTHRDLEAPEWLQDPKAEREDQPSPEPFSTRSILAAGIGWSFGFSVGRFAASVLYQNVSGTIPGVRRIFGGFADAGAAKVLGWIASPVTSIVGYVADEQYLGYVATGLGHAAYVSWMRSDRYFVAGAVAADVARTGVEVWKRFMYEVAGPSFAWVDRQIRGFIETFSWGPLDFATQTRFGQLTAQHHMDMLRSGRPPGPPPTP